MSKQNQNSPWYTPAERLPTHDDGPRRFKTKVEVEVECALGVERRCYFVGGGFDDDDCLGKRVTRWRPIDVKPGHEASAGSRPRASNGGPSL